MNELGSTLATGGFLPTEPRVGDIFSKLNLLQNGVAGLKNIDATKHLAEAIERPENELKRSYARFYHGTAHAQDMKAILEDILNQTLRRGHMAWKEGWTLEQYAAYGISRSGQDGIAIYMMKMMQDGIDLPAPKAAAKKGRKK